MGWAGSDDLCRALLQAVSGFGRRLGDAAVSMFAPAPAVQLVIIIPTALSLAVVPGCGARPGLLRLTLGGLAQGCRLASSPSAMPMRSWCGSGRGHNPDLRHGDGSVAPPRG
jgi:hypothetical protein